MFEFTCKGHKNILATHKNTIEFTKEEDLTLNGDCILGINADFDYSKLAGFVKDNNNKRIKCRIILGDFEEEFSFTVNKDFCDEKEIVIRRGEFNSERTLGLRCDKAAVDIKRELIEELKKGKELKVSFYEEKNP